MKEYLKLRNYKDYINYIVAKPVWRKEEIRAEKNDVKIIGNIKELKLKNVEYVYTDNIIYTAYNYETPEDKEDVRQCLYLHLAIILDRIKKTGYIDKKQKYPARNFSSEEVVKLVKKFLRNAATRDIYKILKIGKKEKIKFDEETIKDADTVNQTIIDKIAIKEIVKKYLRRIRKDSLSVLIFLKMCGKLKVNDENVKDILDIIDKTDKKDKKVYELYDKDIAEIFGVCTDTVERHRKKLKEDFKEFYLKQING